MATESVFSNLASVPAGEFQSFAAPGLREKATGVVFADGAADCGVPLGGLGTGYLELRSDGTLGASTQFNTFLTPHLFDSAALAIAVGDQVRLLALSSQGAAKGARSVRYWGHYPVADVTFGLDLPLEIWLRAFTPFVPGDAAASNIPGAVLAVHLCNRDSETVECRVGFSFRGPPAEEGETYLRQSLSGKDGGLRGAVVRHSHEQSYALGVLQGDTVHVGSALGADDAPWRALTGELPQPDDHDAGTTVAADLTLEPGVTKTLYFVLAWYYPTFRDSGGHPHFHQYSFRFQDAADVAGYLADNHANLLGRTLAWQDVIYGSDLPGWLKDALVNGLYSLGKNTLWIRSPRPDDWWGEEGLFTHSESFTGCPITETMVCRFHGHFPALLLFSELELTTLRNFAHFQLKSGEIPFSFGRLVNMYRPQYYCQHPLDSAQYVQLVYRYFVRTGDKSALQELYPFVKDATGFCKRLDTDGDGLVNDHPHARPGEIWPANQFYDIWPWFGTSAYVAGIWLATLRCGEAMAIEMEDPEFAADCRVWFERGMKAYEEKLWNGRFYRVYCEPETERCLDVALFNQLMGEWCARVVGLDSLFPSQRATSVMETLEELNLRATNWLPVNAACMDGSAYVSRPDQDENDHASQCFVGENLCGAMTMIYAGRDEAGLEVARRIVESIFVRHRTPWNQYCIINAKDGHPIWGSDYYSNMVIWALPMALRGEGLRNSREKSNLVCRILEAGRPRSPTD